MSEQKPLYLVDYLYDTREEDRKQIAQLIQEQDAALVRVAKLQAHKGAAHLLLIDFVAFWDDDAPMFFEELERKLDVFAERARALLASASQESETGNGPGLA